MLNNVSLEMGILDLSAKNCEIQQRTCQEHFPLAGKQPREGKNAHLEEARPAAPPHTQISRLLSPNFDFNIYKMMALETTKDIYAVSPQQQAMRSEASKCGTEWFLRFERL